MKAQLRSLISVTRGDIKNYRPNGPFGLNVRAMIGPEGERGEESFDFTVCTPEWFAANKPQPFTLGRHFLFVTSYDYPALEKFVRDYCATCTGDNWQAIAEKLGRLGYWEFEDYVP